MALKKFYQQSFILRVLIFVGLTFFLYGFISGIVRAVKLYGNDGLGIPAQLIKHYSKAGSFTFTLPETWGIVDTPQGNGEHKDVILVATNFFASPYIEVSRLLSVNIQQLTDWGVEKAQLNNGSEYELLSLQDYPTTMHYLGVAHEYLLVKAHPIFGKRDFRCLDWYVVPKNDEGFSFSFCVEKQKWDEIRGTFFEIINSIEFD